MTYRVQIPCYEEAAIGRTHLYTIIHRSHKTTKQAAIEEARRYVTLDGHRIDRERPVWCEAAS